MLHHRPICAALAWIGGVATLQPILAGKNNDQIVAVVAELFSRKWNSAAAIAIDNDLRGTLRNFGLMVGIAGRVKFEARSSTLSAIKAPDRGEYRQVARATTYRSNCNVTLTAMDRLKPSRNPNSHEGSIAA
jgi:hypothetical protein